MQFIRKSLVGLAAALLTVTLFWLGVSWSLQHVFGTPQDIKQALRQSHFYDVAVANALDQTQKNQDKNTGQDNVPVDKPEIRTIIQQAFPPEFLQTQTEQVLDSTYAWLGNNNKTPLNFTIDLTEAKTRLADGLATYVQQHLSSLPVCTAATMPAPGTDVDIFTAACVPPGYNINLAANKARDQILTGDFLKDAKISSSTIKTNDGKTLDQQLHLVPTVYHRVQQGIMGAVLLAVLLAAGMVFASATWRGGLRRLGIILLTSGGVAIFLGLASSFAVHRAAHELTKRPELHQPWQQKLFDIAGLLANDLRHWWVLYGIVLVVIGVGTFVALHFLLPRPDQIHERETPKPEAGEPTSEATGEDKPKLTDDTSNKPEKPTPKKKLVQ